MIEKTNAKVIVCKNLIFFVVTKKRWKGKKIFESDQDLVGLDQSHPSSYIDVNVKSKYKSDFI